MIKLAQTHDLKPIMAFYEQVITTLAKTAFPSGWKKGIYPDELYVANAIAHQESFLDWRDDTIVSAMVLNSAANPGYTQAAWQVQAAPAAILLIHTLAVAPALQGQGIAQQMVKFAIDYGRSHHKLALHLDALATNLPAQKVYLACGFTYITTLKLFYPDTGVTSFLLYEFVL
ncbi:GNAT family N-acetyltransferase [Loigolactobacillus binensis]|uniref:GNAT family N-acetyltransferase n=1 Tax=Loigolactobacillus binensis TaxID=2559922 RepID=A0ABW3ECE9_9LACO|nr:GNAT family N-acetyltransferase [Loigolactobacillus binensis]